MKQAHDSITVEDQEKELKKIETFRVGSSGALVDDKMYATSCGRLAQARFFGHQSPPTQEMRVMFNGGFTLEDFITKRLQVLGLTFKQEQEYNIEITPGLVVSGRPDFEVMIDGEEVGIEVKSLASPFSVMKQRRNGFPFMKHMLQAATYMTLLKKDKWLIAIGHSFHVNDKGMKIPPSIVWYELTFINNMFIVTNDRNENAALPFTKEHLIGYYQALQQGNKEGKLVSRPTEKELNVDTYDRCKYCPMQSACNEYDNKQIDFQQWLMRVLTSKEKEQ